MSEENTENPAQDDTEESEVEAHSAEDVLGLQKLKAEHGGAPGMVAPGSTGSCGVYSCS
jgi:hypothetical protein